MDLDDIDIIKRIHASDVKAFEWLFHHYYQPLCLFANRFLNDTELSKECVSDLFSHLWEKRETITVTISLRSYLHRSVQNRCLNLLKKKKIENKYVDFVMRTGLINDRAYQEKITDGYYSKELTQKINEAIGQLPDRCQEIFRLSRFEHLSYKEIAQKLALSPKTVENQMGIALSKLKQSLNRFLSFWIFFC